MPELPLEKELDPALAPIQAYLDDPKVLEIMVNGYQEVYLRMGGRSWKLQKAASSFGDNAAVCRMLDALLKPLEMNIDEKHPMVNARFMDGSRLFAVIPPVALNGPTVVIRKFQKSQLTMEKLIQFGSLTAPMADFIELCVHGHLNILISGGIGSGKTTLLNIMSDYLPKNERVITIEHQADLQIRQEHVISLESRPPDAEGHSGVSVKSLVVSSHELRPDYVLLGELEGEEVLEVLRLADRGQTIHALAYANHPQEALERLEMFVKMERPNLPAEYIRSLIGSAFDVIIQQDRLEDGSRKVTRVSLLQTQDNAIKLHDVFVFQRDRFENGKVIGHTENHPVTLELYQRLSARGLRLAPELLPEGIE